MLPSMHCAESQIPPTRRRAGFTLVEVMMASTLLLVGFVGMIGAVTLSANGMDQARRETLAGQILAHEIDKIRLTSWSDISGLTANNTTLTIDSQFTDAVAASGATYVLTRNFTNPNPETNLREVNFTVTWTVKTSRTSGGQLVTFSYSRRASTYLGKYGLHLSYQRS
jgi:prepilin-type N-terminal cleavage/methylation domain-containing protein